MGKSISIHSSRGGTGKTLLATNLAVLYAQSGFNIALIDLDFRAPSLMGVFSKLLRKPVECFLNSYLDGRCSVDSLMVDMSNSYNLKGKLFVGFSNPDITAIRNTAERSRAWEVTSVKRLFALRSKLFNEMKINYCIYDTSPGIQYTSINAIVTSDLSIVVTTLDSLDLDGTKNMVTEIYDAFERKTMILLNKVFPQGCVWSNEEKSKTVNQIEDTFKRPVLGAIPCYCDVLEADRSKLLAIEQPNHPFIKNLEKIKEKIESLANSENPSAKIQ